MWWKFSPAPPYNLTSREFIKIGFLSMITRWRHHNQNTKIPHTCTNRMRYLINDILKLEMDVNCLQIAFICLYFYSVYVCCQRTSIQTKQLPYLLLKVANLPRPQLCPQLSKHFLQCQEIVPVQVTRTTHTDKGPSISSITAKNEKLKRSLSKPVIINQLT